MKQMNSEGISRITLSSIPAVNDLMRQQEAILLNLVQKIKTPFRDEWEYIEWHRTATALQLGFFGNNELLLDNRACWEYLIEGAKTEEGYEITEEGRSRIIFAIHTHLERTYSMARQELSKREVNNDEQE
jgi:hypothetical protein